MSSEATAIRDAIYDRLKDWPGYAKVRKIYVPQVQPDQLPVLSIIIIAEQMKSDGDDNAGEIRFRSEVTIAISALRGFDDPVNLDGSFDDDIDAIENRLLTDAEFTKLHPTGLFEAVSAINRRRLFLERGEAYFSELRLDMTFVCRPFYQPIVSDDYLRTVITSRPLGHDAAPPVTVDVTIDQSAP